MKIYFDGVQVSADNGQDRIQADHWIWKKVTKLDIPSTTKVIGIECQNWDGPKGILASTTDGIVTNKNWLCSSNEQYKSINGIEGVWSRPDYISSNFKAAIGFGFNSANDLWGRIAKPRQLKIE